MIYRHIAFVNALRVFLRKRHDYHVTSQNELFEVENEYHDAEPFLPHMNTTCFAVRTTRPIICWSCRQKTGKEPFDADG